MKPAAVESPLQFKIAALGPPWKLMTEFLPFHPSASHVSPEYRDGWNYCYLAAKAEIDKVCEAIEGSLWVVVAAERVACARHLETMHEQAAGEHNYYAVAARQLRERTKP